MRLLFHYSTTLTPIADKNSYNTVTQFIKMVFIENFSNYSESMRLNVLSNPKAKHQNKAEQQAELAANANVQVADTLRPQFWSRFRLDELNHSEWEALCDGCGCCCLIKYIDEDEQGEDGDDEIAGEGGVGDAATELDELERRAKVRRHEVAAGQLLDEEIDMATLPPPPIDAGGLRVA